MAKNDNLSITKTYFTAELLSLLSSDFDPNHTAMSKLFTGINNPSLAVTTKMKFLSDSDYKSIAKSFDTIIMRLLNPNKLADTVRIIEVAIAEDPSINADTEVDLITKTKKKELIGYVNHPSSFLAGVFLYVVRSTKNPGKSGIIGPIVSHLLQVYKSYEFPLSNNTAIQQQEDEMDAFYSNPLLSDIYNEQIDQKASVFCITFDSQKNLIPLCQFVQITNPTRQHNREMFNAFCCCKRSVQKKILASNHIDLIQVADHHWWYEYINKFKCDYMKYELGDPRYWYLFAQYFPKLLWYGKTPVDDFLAHTFSPRVSESSLRENDILGLIGEYMFYNKPYSYPERLEPPMDFLWKKLNFSRCSEAVLVIYLALFIIATCYSLPKKYESETIEGDYGHTTIYDVETAEDLFYMTLFTLYETYTE